MDSYSKDHLSALPVELILKISKHLDLQDAISLAGQGRVFDAVLHDRIQFAMLDYWYKDGGNVAHWAAERDRVDTLEQILIASQRLRSRRLRDRVTVNLKLKCQPYILNEMKRRHRLDRGPHDTPLMVAASKNSINALRFLLAWPGSLVKVNMANNLGDTALHYAASAGSVAGTRLLLQHCADVKASNGYYFTPLHRAVQGGNEQVVRDLVDAGANIEQSCSYANTYHLRAVELAALLGYRGIFEYLVFDRNCDPFLGNGSGHARGILHLAAYGGSLAICGTLIQLDCHLVRLRDFHGQIPLHYAADQGHMEVVRLLVEAGSNPMAMNYFRRTPLQLACFKGHWEVVRYILGFFGLHFP